MFVGVLFCVDQVLHYVLSWNYKEFKMTTHITHNTSMISYPTMPEPMDTFPKQQMRYSQPLFHAFVRLTSNIYNKTIQFPDC